MTDKLPPLIPHLVVNGASDAIEFYKKALGAAEVMRVPAQDGKRLMHAHLVINGATLFLVDDFPEHRGECGNGSANITTPAKLGGTPAMMHLEVENCDASMKRAVDAGAKVIMEPFDAFWGARYGQIQDPFGHCWSFAHPKPAA